jgi:hypothetical protein
MLAQPSANGIADDISAGPGEMFFGFDECQPVAARKEISAPIVPFVERLTVEAVEPLQAPRQRRVRNANDEVVVIRHQAEDVDEPLVALHHVCEELREEAAVVVGAENRHSVDPARAHVKGAVGVDIARRAACHAFTVRSVEASPSPDETCLWT